MFELSRDVAGVADLIFGICSIWMAHTLYKTPRRVWQTVLTWVLIYIFLILCTTPIAELMPTVSYERVSMLMGFCGIFAYLYLFPNIPVSQRLFTYFLVDTCQTLLVLFPRICATLIAQLFGTPVDVVFLCLYFPLVAVFCLVFYKKLRGSILSSLRAFRTKLSSLAVFAAVGYITLLLQVPTWEPWPALTFWTAGGAFGMIVFVLMGYLLAFRTLSSLILQQTTENAARQLSSQMALSEQYYKTLLERIEQSRIRNHDMRHHVNVMSGLCAEENWPELRLYVENMGRELPSSPHQIYCGNGALDALLSHYESLCAENNIPFVCQVRLPDTLGVNPLHLCVILGNGLQNAMEAALLLPPGSKPHITVKAVMSEERVVISITNPYQGQLVVSEDGNIPSHKDEPGHGLGLASIREITRRYNGWCGISSDEGIFTLNVTLTPPK